MGSVTSYARARAESLGMQAKVGIAERADRLVAILAMTGLAGIFDAPVLIAVTLAALAVASTVTVIQRMLLVRSQAKDQARAWRPDAGPLMPGSSDLVRGMAGGLAAADQLTTAGYLSGWRLVRLLPERRALALFRRIADELYRRQGRSVQRLRANLGRVRPDLSEPDLDALTREAVRSYLRYWCESFRLPAWPVDDVVRRTRTVDEHHLRDAYAAGGGAVVALPHMANWDWAGAWACATGMPLATVAERLEPERLYDEFVAYRSTLGMEILPLTGGDAPCRGSSSGCAAGDWLPARRPGPRPRTGIEVDLCGRRARMPRGPAVLARRTGAPLVPATLHYAGPDLVITFHPPVPHAEGDAGLVRMMQGVADAFTGGAAGPPAGLAHDAAGVRRRPGARVDEGRPRLPLLPRRPRRGAEPRQGPRRGADRPGPRGLRARAHRERRPAGVRRAGRPRGGGVLQRRGGPDVLRPGGRGPGPPLAARGRLRRAAPARAGHSEPVAARAVGGRLPGGGDLPLLQRPLPGTVGVRGDSARDRSLEEW